MSSYGNEMLYEARKKFELKTCLVGIDNLRPHEETVKERIEFLKKLLVHSGYVKYPILVDLNTLVILDGHHRVEAIRKLGLEMVPVFLVDYQRDYVIVKSFRKDFIVTKDLVLKSAYSGKLLPPKTSRHLLKSISVPASFIPLYFLSLYQSNITSCLPVFPERH